jgi:mitochondrial fission protein ELM1
MTLTPETPLTIWRFTDGKPGHEKQTLGLAHALLRHRAGKCHDIPAPGRGMALLYWLQGRFPASAALPAPDLLLGAGHATHFALLAARRAYGGKAVVLMKPSLPLNWFDACVIPQHDQPSCKNNVLAINGVLNAVQPTGALSPSEGLMLIGGVSAHFRWDNVHVAANVRRIADATPHIQWKLTTSRRTPAEFLAVLGQPLPSNLKLYPHEETGPGWLEQALTLAGQVWVTEDSVSMLYEALTAGAGVGLIRLDDPHDTRVRRGVEQLVAERRVTPFEAWQAGAALTAAPGGFNEATRVAQWLLQRFPQLTSDDAKH